MRFLATGVDVPTALRSHSWLPGKTALDEGAVAVDSPLKVYSSEEHRGMEVVEKSDLGQGGWIPTDRYRLTMEGYDNIYVVGDTTNLPVSKTY